MITILVKSVIKELGYKSTVVYAMDPSTEDDRVEIVGKETYVSLHQDGRASVVTKTPEGKFDFHMVSTSRELLKALREELT